MPVNEAGCLIDPPVSVPIEIGVSWPATAAADPPDDPPGTKFLSIGLCTFPKKLVSFDDPIANSSQFNLPSKIPPSFQIFWVTVDSYVGKKLFKILLPAVVLTPFVQNKSLTAIGIPGNFKSRFGFWSNFLALSSESEKFSEIYAFSFFDFLDRSTKAFVTSSEDSFLFLIFVL